VLLLRVLLLAVVPVLLAAIFNRLLDRGKVKHTHTIIEQLVIPITFPNPIRSISAAAAAATATATADVTRTLVMLVMRLLR
jgi:hypothetical protein